MAVPPPSRARRGFHISFEILWHTLDSIIVLKTRCELRCNLLLGCLCHPLHASRPKVPTSRRRILWRNKHTAVNHMICVNSLAFVAVAAPFMDKPLWIRIPSWMVAISLAVLVAYWLWPLPAIVGHWLGNL